MRFSDIIGHKNLKSRLIKTVIDKRVSHAQLFLGEQGLEKLQMAVAYAQFISCRDKQFYNEGDLPADSCGKCTSCKKYEKLIHPDLHFVYPVANTKKIKSKAISKNFIAEWREALLESNFYLQAQDWYKKIDIENKQGSISVNEANDIIKTINIKPYESEYKVVIIWLAEKLYHSAAPKLLKSLEEPPSKTLFILITENQDQIISTILSRTQLVKFNRHSDDILKQKIKEEYDLDNDKVNHIVNLSEGNYLNCLNHLEESARDEFNFNNFREIMQKAYLNDVISMKKISNDLSGIGRESIKSLLNYGLRIVRLCMINSAGAKEIIKSDGEELNFIDKLSAFVNKNNSENLSRELETAISYIGRNTNPKITLFDMMLKISSIIRRKDAK